jgi:hypothetical protein
MSGMYRAVAVVAIVLVAFGAALVSAGTAWSAPGHAAGAHDRSSQPQLSYDNATQQFILQLPTPVCPKTAPDCQWLLWVNEPQVSGMPLIGAKSGSAGTMTITVPNFCGVVQADVDLGPAPWTFVKGLRRHLDSCESTTTTTSGAAPTTTTTTSGAAPSTTTTVAPTTTTVAPTTTTTTVAPKVAAASTTTVALPFTAATSSSTTTPGAVAATSTATQLPFTGVDLRPLVLLGTLMIIIGGFLLSTVESRRRLLRRATAVKLDQVKDGARKTSSWFLGL